jgi:iron complex transport system substrate-binding protein
VTVPADPQSVVAAIGSFDVDMVAVGVMPVLTTTFAGPWVSFDESVEKTENVPPTVEELVGLEPDLMIGWTWVTKEPVFETLSAVVPYVGMGESAATAGPGFDGSEPLRSWDTLFLSVCDAVNRREQGVQLVDEFESRLDDVAERRSAMGEVSVARIEFYEQGLYTYRGQNEDTAALMDRIGLTVVGPEQTNNAASLETLPDIDADWLVVSVGGGSLTQDRYDAVAATDVYQAIPAVQAGRVHVVDGALWPGLGYLWAQALVDDLERLFV